MNKIVLLEAALDIQQILITSGVNVSETLLKINMKKMNKKVLMTNARKMQKLLPTFNMPKQDVQTTQDSQVNNNNDINLTQHSSSSIQELQQNHHNDNELTELLNNLKYRLQSVEINLYEAEVRINKFEQYTRRENLEISGIPDSISQDQLENTV